MFRPSYKLRFKGAFQAAVFVVLVAFMTTTSIIPTQRAFAQSLKLPAPGTMLRLTNQFMPALVKGIKVDPNNPLAFDFLIEPGQIPLSLNQKKQEYRTLIKYFLASLTTPEKDMWVNLSPYESNRIISTDFGATEMGRNMLGQDYILKQLTASLIYPESNLGKKFWDRIYSRVRAQFGDAQVPVNTFNKVWILPDSITIFEKGNVAMVVNAHLKVMLEEDYLSLDKHANSLKMGLNESTGQFKIVNRMSSQVIREVILPEIEREVNEGQNFAQLRQMFYSMALASWFKQRLKLHVLNKIYTNQNKNVGIELQDPKDNDRIYKEYLKAFKKGVYNYIKEEADPNSGAVIPRKYFSGGLNCTAMATAPGPGAVLHFIGDASQAVVNAEDDLDIAKVRFQEASRSIIEHLTVKTKVTRNQETSDVESLATKSLTLTLSEERVQALESIIENSPYWNLSRPQIEQILWPIQKELEAYAAKHHEEDGALVLKEASRRFQIFYSILPMILEEMFPKDAANMKPISYIRKLRDLKAILTPNGKNISARYSAAEFKGKLTVKGLAERLRRVRGIEIPENSEIEFINNHVLNDRKLYLKYSELNLPNDVIESVNGLSDNELKSFNRNLIEQGDSEVSPKILKILNRADNLNTLFLRSTEALTLKNWAARLALEMSVMDADAFDQRTPQGQANYKKFAKQLSSLQRQINTATNQSKSNTPEAIKTKIEAVLTSVILKLKNAPAADFGHLASENVDAANPTVPDGQDRTIVFTPEDHEKHVPIASGLSDAPGGAAQPVIDLSPENVEVARTIGAPEISDFIGTEIARLERELRLELESRQYPISKERLAEIFAAVNEIFPNSKMETLDIKNFSRLFSNLIKDTEPSLVATTVGKLFKSGKEITKEAKRTALIALFTRLTDMEAHHLLNARCNALRRAKLDSLSAQAPITRSRREPLLLAATVAAPATVPTAAPAEEPQAIPISVPTLAAEPPAQTPAARQPVPVSKSFTEERLSEITKEYNRLFLVNRETFTKTKLINILNEILEKLFSPALINSQSDSWTPAAREFVLRVISDSEAEIWLIEINQRRRNVLKTSVSHLSVQTTTPVPSELISAPSEFEPPSPNKKKRFGWKFKILTGLAAAGAAVGFMYFISQHREKTTPTLPPPPETNEGITIPQSNTTPLPTPAVEQVAKTNTPTINPAAETNAPSVSETNKPAKLNLEQKQELVKYLTAVSKISNDIEETVRFKPLTTQEAERKSKEIINELTTLDTFLASREHETDTRLVDAAKELRDALKLYFDNFGAPNSEDFRINAHSKQFDFQTIILKIGIENGIKRNRDIQIKERTNASLHPSSYGGIDFDDKYLQMNLQGDNAQMTVPAGFQWLLKTPISGFIPQILNIRSGVGYNLSFFKGLLTAEQQREAAAHYHQGPLTIDHQYAMKSGRRQEQKEEKV